MRFSIGLTNYSWKTIGSQLAEVVQAADEGGLDTVWVPDHLIQADPNSTPTAEMLEAYTTLGFIAAQTRQIRLGAMVTGATFRAPSLLVKAVTTLDVLSGGRAWLGIGAGYNDSEARIMGLFMPPAAERFERLEETLRLAVQMWSGDDSPFESTHFRLEQPINSPQAVQRPHPPILIGGMGEKKTLRLVAQYGNACNLFDIPDGGRTVSRKLAVLAEHCERIGRSYDAIEKTLSSRFDPDEPAESFAQRCAGFAELGIEHVVLITNGPWTPETVARLAAAAAHA